MEIFIEKMPIVKITNRVKTLLDACNILDVRPPTLSKLFGGIYDDYDSALAYLKLSIIARALNEGWKPNWNDRDERKYVPWFKTKMGVGFSYCGCGDWLSNTSVGSRLCYKTQELAEYAGEQFIDIYRDFLNYKELP